MAKKEMSRREEIAARAAAAEGVQRSNRVKLTPGTYLGKILEVKFLEADRNESNLEAVVVDMEVIEADGGTPVGSEFCRMFVLNPTGKNASLQLNYTIQDMDDFFSSIADSEQVEGFTWDNPQEDRQAVILETEEYNHALKGVVMRALVKLSDKTNKEGVPYTKITYKAVPAENLD